MKKNTYLSFLEVHFIFRVFLQKKGNYKNVIKRSKKIKIKIKKYIDNLNYTTNKNLKLRHIIGGAFKRRCVQILNPFI
jgi:hypothetical protein